MGSFLVLRTGPITNQRDTKRIDKTLNNAHTTTQKPTNNGFHNIQNTPVMDIWLPSDKCLSYSTGFSDFEGNDHGKRLMENLWLNFWCRSPKKRTLRSLLVRKTLHFIFLFLTGNPFLMQKNFELYMPVDFQHIQ